MIRNLSLECLNKSKIEWIH